MTEIIKQQPEALEKHEGSAALYTNIRGLFREFGRNHLIFATKGNKAAGGRARKAVGEVKKLVTDYRKASVTESK